MSGKAQLCSGFGQYHTDKNGSAYDSITLDEIFKMSVKPTSVAKNDAAWVIFSELKSRVFKEQLENGSFHAIWCDVDSHCEIDSIKCVLAKLDCKYLVHSSSRSKVEKKKWRAIVPLAEPANGSDYTMLAQILNDRLENAGITPDRASERPAQLCYLPNRDPDESTFYEQVANWSSRLDWRVQFKDELQAKREQAGELVKQVQQAKELSRIKAVDRVASGGLSPVDAFKASYDLETVMRDYGYKRVGDKWVSPLSSSGKAGVIIKGDRWISSHGSDAGIGKPKDGNQWGDAFDLFVYFEHGGNENSAMKAAGSMLTTSDGVTLTKANQRKHMASQENSVVSENDTLIELTPNDAKDLAELSICKTNSSARLDLLRHIDDNHIIKRLVKSVSAATFLPESTILLNGLGVFSSVATRKWAVAYQGTGRIPIGLYVVTEQPSGTSKSRSLTVFQSPFFAEHKRQRDAILESIEGDTSLTEKEMRDKSIWVKHKALFVSNATPEALEETLNAAGGYFSAVASEQGLINSLLGLSYGDGKSSNNDLVLNGFDGGYMSSIRITRGGYSGFVGGGVTLFAQQGSIETLLTQSNGTGLSERFLMLAEPHSLGARNHTDKPPIESDLLNLYGEYCCDVMDGFYSKDSEIQTMELSHFSWREINEFRDELEPLLADGQKYSHGSLRGAIGKVDMQIMKIAACLQLLSPNNNTKSIEPRYVTSAIAIMRDLTQEHLAILESKGLIGQRAEFEAIIRLFENNPTRTLNQIRTSRIRQQEPFKSSANPSALIKSTLAELCGSKILMTANGTNYTLIS